MSVRNVALPIVVFCAFFASCAQAGFSVMREIESIVRVTVYLPATTELSPMGSDQDRIRFLAEAPGMEVQTADPQRLSEVVEAISGAEFDGCDRNVDAGAIDALVRVSYKDGRVGEYAVRGSGLVASGTHKCYAVPDWIGRAISI